MAGIRIHEGENHLGNLTQYGPEEVLPHGPSKIYIDAWHYHSPYFGAVASYTVRERDTRDHYGIYRGVDQVESFAQAVPVGCGVFVTALKHRLQLREVGERFWFLFLELREFRLHRPLATGDRLVVLGFLESYRFNQLTTTGRIYKAPEDLDLNAYGKTFTDDKLQKFELDKSFLLVSEIQGLTGRIIEKTKFEQKNG